MQRLDRQKILSISFSIITALSTWEREDGAFFSGNRSLDNRAQLSAPADPEVIVSLRNTFLPAKIGRLFTRRCRHPDYS